MYALKHGRRATKGEAREVLLAVLGEREPDLQRHMHDVAELARAVGTHLGLDAEDLDVVVRAAELHDIGKVAVPDTILHKPGPLDEAEWSFIRQHTIIGERIVGAAEALRPVGARRARQPRALGRRRLPRRPGRRGHPARGSHRLRLRRLGRDDLRPRLSQRPGSARRRPPSCAPTRARSSTRTSSSRCWPSVFDANHAGASR